MKEIRWEFGTVNPDVPFKYNAVVQTLVVAKRIVFA
jgi:hypothetical protein